MKVIFLLLLCSSLSFAYSIWPQPQEVHSEKTFFLISRNEFNVTLVKSNKDDACDLVESAIDRYRHKLFFIQSCANIDEDERKNLKPDTVDFTRFEHYGGELKNLVISVEGKCEEEPFMNMDESYSISVNKENQARITAETSWGVLRALDTFSQMLAHAGKDQFTIQAGTVKDFPRFSHRGLLLDTSRHFLSVKSIKQTLDAMEANKMNVFHWHIVDDHSFPYVSEDFPALSEKGSYKPSHVYDRHTVKDIIEYARQRGIRVVAEFDTPGHTQSWGKGQPGLLTQCYSNGKPNGYFGPIDPTKESAYDFLKTLFYEIVNVFPDKFTHLGGDEVSFSCWASNPNIQKFMKEKKLSNYAQLEELYIQRLVDIVANLNMSYIVWQEVFDNGVKIKEDTIVHVWKGEKWQDEMSRMTKAGYHTLLSACWYLNVISYGTDWDKYYKCDPTDFTGDAQQKKLVLGGEACMWGEWVDASNVIPRTWPRASAVAERLWSSENLKNPGQARARFHAQHCRLQKMGIRAEPIEGPGNYCDCDHVM